ncbi:hypothetical protein A1O3_02356 [Capronia epimyces CBS 606.96]|uniref:Uncharacterized protein n=1 Tax=Capronia epimyces CBS 606.96 TaxID=1182542 RepID=W9YHY6_9EURO|nr:uncharacterized protein A1O3_02356 [Capronia epimyces CBS 606.96]EXJ89290.1 hypothetical protein A1O3_02356 [Capronia epimyces CBS 606.96]
MHLRSIIKPPARYEDLEAPATQSPNATKPVYPAKLRARIVPFNPNHPPAAFPSLPLTAHQPHGSTINTPPANLSEVPTNTTSPSETSLGRNLVHATDPVKGPYTAQPHPSSCEQLSATGSDSEMDDDDTDTDDDDIPTWNSLPLSLQYHIYTRLSSLYSPQDLAEVLGLKDDEATEIAAAVHLRHVHPASLAEIWNYCSRNGAQVPGLDQSVSWIDPALLSTFMDYMLFASKYELAYGSEVRLAADFLSLCSLPVELLGTWLPDPHEPRGSAFLTHASGMLRHDGDSTRLDSGYSSFTEIDHTDREGERDQTIKSAESRAEESLEDGPVTRKKQPVQQSTPARVMKNREAKKNNPKYTVPKSQKKQGRHPLAIVTMPDASASPPRSSFEKTQPTDTRRAGSRELRARINLNATAATPASETSEKQEYSARARPGHLVLKFKNKVGLAAMRKQSDKESDDVSSEKGSTSSIQSNKTTSVPSKLSGHAPPGKLRIDTRMSSFSRRLLMNAGSPRSPSYSPMSLCSPRSPSYSPISENEDLQEFQALLRGSSAQNLRTGAPGRNLNSVSAHHSNQVSSDTQSPRNIIAAVSGTRPQDQSEKPHPRIMLILRQPKTAGAADQHGEPGKFDNRQNKFPGHLPSDGNDGIGTATSVARISAKAKTGKRGANPGTPARKTAPVKRGPRGPYKKTRERLAREAKADQARTRSALFPKK